jgi:hypothetical protein
MIGPGPDCGAAHSSRDSDAADVYANEPAGSTESPAAEESGSKIRGIEVGEFKIRTDYPVEAQKSTVRFTLFAAVQGEQFAEMQRMVEEHRQKLRDIVITATRMTPLAQLEEPDLATFRRRILIRLRRTIPELAVEDLYISDFGLLVRSL